MKGHFVEWLKAALIRAARTFAQTAAGLITVGAVASDVEWGTVFSAAAVAAVYSLLTSIGGLPEVPEEENTHPPEEENC